MNDSAPPEVLHDDPARLDPANRRVDRVPRDPSDSGSPLLDPLTGEPAGGGDPIDFPGDVVELEAEPDVDVWAAAAAPTDEPVEMDPTIAMADEEPGREPWGTRRWFETITSWVVVALVTIFVISQLQPAEILTAAVPTGGDLGAHVWAPAYLRDHLLPHGRISGWSMDWYSGLPVYRFYMIPPAMAILALDLVLPYGMAMKIVAVLGCITLPVCLYAFGKLARLPYPLPAMFAVAGAVFLFDETFTILGGNIASTMAGEFSFSIALSLAMLAFGVFARGMETGRHRPLAVVLIALAMLSHGLVMIFVGLGLVFLCVMWIDVVFDDTKRIVYAVTTGATALLLSAFWLGPFVLTSKFMTDMKYEGAPTYGSEWNSYWKMFFPHSSDADRFWVVLAIVGFVAGVVRRHRVVSWLGVYSLILTAMVFFAQEGIPGFGLLWNVRLLPFIFLLRYLLAMVGIAEIAWGLLRWRRDRALARRVDEYGDQLPPGGIRTGFLSPVRVSARKFYASIALLGMVAATGVGWLSWHLGKFPGQREVYHGEGKTDADKWRFEWLGIDIATSKNNGFVDGWARHNFTGYEGKPAYGEYKAVLETMKGLGSDPAHGCGRALWEHTDGAYGTPMALMLLPFWTDSCIGSSEGLFFEASATTPYHFLASAALSEKASNPVRGLTYEDRNAELGVRFLQTLGIRYYMAYTPGAIDRASKQPELIEVAQSGPWRIYEVAGSDLVKPLTIEPVVINDRDGDKREMWLEIGASWYQHPEKWAALPAADGPSSWQRVDVVSDDPQPYPKVDLVRPQQPVQTRNLEPVTVSDVRMGDESISFRVDRPGVPVLVRTSWFPNWEVSGANGPYRVAPNMMVVVPRSTEVRLTYGNTGIDYASWLATLFGLVVLGWLCWQGRMRFAPELGPPPYPVDPDPFGPDPYDLEAGWSAAPVPAAGSPGGWSPFLEADGDAAGIVDVDDDAWLDEVVRPLQAPGPETLADAPPPPPPGYGGPPHG